MYTFQLGSHLFYICIYIYIYMFFVEIPAATLALAFGLAPKPADVN